MLWRYAQHCMHSYGELLLLRGDTTRRSHSPTSASNSRTARDSPKNAIKAHRLRGQVFAARGDVATTRRPSSRAAIEHRTRDRQRRTALADATRRSATCCAMPDATDEAREQFEHALQVVDQIASGLTDEALKAIFLGAERVASMRASSPLSYSPGGSIATIGSPRTSTGRLRRRCEEQRHRADQRDAHRREEPAAVADRVRDRTRGRSRRRRTTGRRTR